ncbi:MAG: right-handed parallel beta-helix repeat-containing protein [Dehalococcoidia bacterium]
MRVLLGLLTIVSLAVAIGVLAGPARADATFTVNTTSDAADLAADVTCDSNAAPGLQCSLRAAIQEANNSTAFDTINFAIGSGQVTIDINSTGLGALPAVTRGVLIDGTSQPGYNAGTPTPMIELKGTLVVGTQEILSIATTTASTIKGLAITDSGGNGIEIEQGSGHVIQGNYIGLRLDGTTVLGNNSTGIIMASGTSAMTIGGNTVAQRNVISGNGIAGINTYKASNNIITGNFIGSDAGGTLDRGNGGDGILVDSTSSGNVISGANLISGNTGAGVLVMGSSNSLQGNIIGPAFNGTALPNSGGGVRVTGTAGSNTVGIGNIISGNTGNGVSIEGGSNTVVKGNQIGTWTGNTAMANGVGISVSGSPTNTTIGGAILADRNVISGNIGDGITISGGTGTIIRGNHIGLGSNGTSDVGNGDDGIGEGGTTGLTIGGLLPGERNVISGNTLNGIQLSGDSHTILGNYIGTSSAGLQARPNAVGIRSIGDGNTIGGTSAGARNVISGNSQHGIEIASSSSNTISGNYIGLAWDGNTDLGNTLDGIFVSGSSNTIGGTEPGSRNVISGNNRHGIELNLTGTFPNNIEGNFIGTDVTGTIDRGNSSDGVRVDASNGNTIGGPNSSFRNVISGNASDGIELINNSDDNTIQSNYIGTNADGTAAIGNNTNGIRLDGSNNSIRANSISGSLAGDGVDIQAASSGNILRANLIGLGANSTIPIGNAFNGIQIQTDSDNNQIGTSVAAETNRIAHSGSGDGIAVGSTSTGNLIGINAIHDNGALGIDLNNDNIVTPNDGTDADTGANNLQNFPAVAGAFRSGTSFGVVYVLQSTPNTTFTLRFFRSTACDASGNGEGLQFIGATAATTSPAGIASAAATFAVYVPAGAAVTATATDPANNTSEFSNCFPAPAFVVNSSADPGDGTCDVTCTLRDAILNTNSVSGLDTIGFAIGSGLATISPTTPLPTITNPVIIDGTTQPGFAGTPIIELNGTNAGADADGLTISAGSSTVRGLVINRFGVAGGVGDGIVLQTNGGNLIEGNYIGTNVAGTAQSGNRGNGVSISSSNNTIGGAADVEGNVISGNNGTSDVGGVEIINGASGNVIIGNNIGTNAAGTAPVANGGHGVLISGAGGNTIGGLQMGAENVISGNFRPGIILEAATNNLIQGNYIGTDLSGTLDLGNNEKGVIVRGGSSNNTFERNIIAFNPGPGIQVEASTGTLITANSMWGQSRLGIALGNGMAATPNDTRDPDTGPNNLQNFPLLVLAINDTDQALVDGALNSTPNTTFTLEYYYNIACHSFGNGEGLEYLAATQVVTDSLGTAILDHTISRIGNFAAGSFITATATDPAGNTSEFSPCVPVTLDADADGDPDAADNCPLWPNPTQALPLWPVPANDLDCDGFSNGAEAAIGTPAGRQCPGAGGTPDSWPADLAPNGTINILDVTALKPVFGQNVPPASARFDIAPSGAINILDVTALKAFFGKTCT